MIAGNEVGQIGIGIENSLDLRSHIVGHLDSIGARLPLDRDRDRVAAIKARIPIDLGNAILDCGDIADTIGRAGDLNPRNILGCLQHARRAQVDIAIVGSDRAKPLIRIGALNRLLELGRQNAPGLELIQIHLDVDLALLATIDSDRTDALRLL